MGGARSSDGYETRGEFEKGHRDGGERFDRSWSTASECLISLVFLLNFLSGFIIPSFNISLTSALASAGRTARSRWRRAGRRRTRLPRLGTMTGVSYYYIIYYALINKLIGGLGCQVRALY